MSRPNAPAIWGFLSIVLVAMGFAAQSPGGFFIGKHEGDTLHLLEILMRMEAGEIPHLDFMTPIGVLAFSPFVTFLDAGFSVAQSIFWGQVLMGVILLPAAWWIAVSRLSGPWPYLFGLIIMTFAVALVHGEAQRSASISMHYNRWAWATAFLAILAALVPARFRRAPVADGVIIGAALSFMALAKVTYFVAFFPPILLALILRRAWTSTITAALVGLLTIALVTVLFGVSFWGAYIADMLEVSGSTVRPQPGEPFTAIMGAPAYIGGSLIAFLAVIVLRQGRRATEGLVLLTLIPGFFYVTYQNYGNDPQWLMLLSVLIFARLPEEGLVNGWGWPLRSAGQMLGVAALALSLPTLFNLVYSPFRHAAIDTAQYTPLMPNDTRNADLRIMEFRAYTLDGRVPLDTPGGGLEAYAGRVERADVGTLNGEPLRRCALEVGMTGWYQAIADDLAANGYSESRILFADLFSSIWLFGDFARLTDGSPWYYGGLPGFESAQYVLVPECPIAMDVRKSVLDAITETGTALMEVHRSPLYVLLKKGG